jgi:hypothetical protein
MKRNNSGYRAIASLARLVRPSPSPDSHALRFPSATRQSGVPARKIFVIKQTTPLSPPTAADKKIHSILIFDDHPESLRLIFARPANCRAYRSASEIAGSRNLILPGVAILTALIATFWMFF